MGASAGCDLSAEQKARAKTSRARTHCRRARAMGFTHAAVGALVRSSYHADRQAHAAGLKDAGSGRS